MTAIEEPPGGRPQEECLPDVRRDMLAWSVRALPDSRLRFDDDDGLREPLDEVHA